MFRFALAIAVFCASPCSAAENAPSEEFIVVISACQAGGECKNFRIPTDAYSILQCQRSIGSAVIARWGDAHPAYTIKSWRCAPASERRI